MRKIALTIVSVGTFALSVSQAFATNGGGTVNACPTTQQFAMLCNLTAGNLQNLLGPAITFVFVIATLIALGYLIWGGIKWILSQGDKQGVEDARMHIISAIIGLVIVFLSYLIINIVLGFFAGPGTSVMNLQLPSINH